MFGVGCSYLFLDASGLTTRAGVWRDGHWSAWRESEAGALEALHIGIRVMLDDAKLPWEQLAGYLYVEGPGSVLGLRLAAMAVRTWQVDDAQRIGHARPVWTCGSLHLAAALALAHGTAVPFSIFTDARQGHWHLLKVDGADPTALAACAVEEIGENALPGGTLYHLPARKVWAHAPQRAQSLPASLHDLPKVLQQTGLLRPVDTATPAGSNPEYKKWKT